MKDENGKLIKKRGILGKMVVIYQPMPKMLTVLKKQGLLKDAKRGDDSGSPGQGRQT